MPVVVGVLKETQPTETRVAVVPEIAAKLKAAGVRVLVERGAGAAAHFPDALYTDVEFSDAPAILGSADVLLKVQPPTPAEVAALKKGAVVVGYMQAYARPDLVRALKSGGITALPWNWCRASPVRSRWTRCPRRRPWPDTRPC